MSTCDPAQLASGESSHAAACTLLLAQVEQQLVSSGCCSVAQVVLQQLHILLLLPYPTCQSLVAECESHRYEGLLCKVETHSAITLWQSCAWFVCGPNTCSAPVFSSVGSLGLKLFSSTYPSRSSGLKACS